MEALYRAELERELWEQRRLSGRQIDPFQLSGSIADAVEHFRKQDPERIERLWQRILGYLAGTGRLRHQLKFGALLLTRSGSGAPPR